MVGKEYEQGGIVRHGSKLINAVSNSGVPAITIILGSSFGIDAPRKLKATWCDAYWQGRAITACVGALTNRASSLRGRARVSP